MISLKKKYRTRNGRKVRALQSYRHHVKGSVNVLELIKGQVFMPDALNQGREDWVWHVWEANGKHQFACAFKGYLHPLDLLEVKEAVEPNIDLFSKQYQARNGVE